MSASVATGPPSFLTRSGDGGTVTSGTIDAGRLPVVDELRSLGNDVDVLGPCARGEVLPSSVGTERDDRARVHRRRHLGGARDDRAGRDPGEDATTLHG